MKLKTKTDFLLRCIFAGFLISYLNIPTLSLKAHEPADPPQLYFGANPPGTKPEVFAPGIISTKENHEFYCAFSPDNKACFFNRGKTIFISKLRDNKWSAPEPIYFGEKTFNKEPHLTFDNKKLFFWSNRGPKGIWLVNRSGDKWENPRFVGEGVFLTSTIDGSIFLTDNQGERGQWKIVKTRLVNDKFSKFEEVTGGMAQPSPSHYPGTHPCVAPDGSFLVFDSYRIGEWGKSADLFICFKKENGAWGKAIKFGPEINDHSVMLATLSPDGKFMFFNRDGDIYWVSTKIFDESKSPDVQ